MDGDATILLSESKDTLIVPIDAIIEQDDKKFVIVKNTDNSLTKKEVVTGIENDTDIEIKEGIDQNDQIIANPETIIKNNYLIF
jgi:multidrug efflux pump subunit AcrA (membrane-fusion protein)